jgi:hypothetical protein
VNGAEPVGIARPKLSEENLAMVGLATYYETNAKISLSLVYKTLKGLDHACWVEIERWQFGTLVKELARLIEIDHPLRVYFSAILDQHEDLRDSRNFVVHAIWGQDAKGRAIGYCYRRKRSCDENEVVRASNDSFRLATLCHDLAYQTALMIASGKISGGNDEAGVSMRTPAGLARF